VTPIQAASIALQRIKNDLDVSCVCHLSHGPLCPKRIAEGALKDVGLLEATDDLGFGARKLQENPGLINAVAVALANRTEFVWGHIEESMRETLRNEARTALAAVDAYERKPTT